MFFWLGMRILTVDSAANSRYILGATGSAVASVTKGDAFGDHLSAVLKRCPEGEVLSHCNGVPSDFGQHSYRKFGGESLAAGPDAPNPMAICDRLNHTLGGEIKKYIKEMSGSDKYCGRICCGLDIYDTMFAILPYRYKRGMEPDFRKIVPNYDDYPACFKVSRYFC